MGGNYDTYAKDDCTAPGRTNGVNKGGVFQDVFQSTQQRIPTLSSVAQNICQEGKKLDKKQYVAYEIIACSFLLCLIDDAQYNLLSTLHNMDANQRDILIQRLRARCGHEQLIMFLSGFAGAGKSTCVKIAQRFCFEFCRAVSIPWNDNTFLFTATT